MTRKLAVLLSFVAAPLGLAQDRCAAPAVGAAAAQARSLVQQKKYAEAQVPAREALTACPTQGINLVFTLFTIIQEINLLQNQQQAFFTSSFFSKWQQNYWNTSRILPKIIPGQFGGMIIHKWIPFLNFDWKPAKAPYDIQG